MWRGEKEGEAEPDWVKGEREQFSTYRDKNSDGHMDHDEVKDWLLPSDYDHSKAEANHLIYESDKNKVRNTPAQAALISVLISLSRKNAGSSANPCFHKVGAWFCSRNFSSNCYWLTYCDFKFVIGLFCFLFVFFFFCFFFNLF